MSMIENVTTAQFAAEVENSEMPVLLDFTAKWCGPCKAVMPLLNDVAREYEGDGKIVKIDIDEEPELAKRFAIRGVPTFIMMHKGEVKERFSGAMTRGNLSALFERYIGEAK